MKILVMIVHANSQQSLADILRELDQVQGFTFSHVEGHGTQNTHDAFLSARDKVVGYVPRIRVDILLDDQHVDEVLSAVRQKSKNPKDGAGLGVFWVTDVHSSGRI